MHRYSLAGFWIFGFRRIRGRLGYFFGLGLFWLESLYYSHNTCHNLIVSDCIVILHAGMHRSLEDILKNWGYHMRFWRSSTSWLLKNRKNFSTVVKLLYDHKASVLYQKKCLNFFHKFQVTRFKEFFVTLPRSMEIFLRTLMSKILCCVNSS